MVQALYAKGASNAEFLQYFCTKIAPKGVFEQVSDKNRLLLLRAVADLSPFTAEPTARASLPTVHDLLKRYLPANANDLTPLSSGAEKKAEPAAAAAAAAPAADGKTDEAGAEKKKPTPIAPVSASPVAGPKINFSSAEAVLFIFHQLCSVSPSAARDVSGLFTPTGQPADFRADLKTKREEMVTRLEFLKGALGTYQQTIKNVEQKISEKLKESKEEEEKKTLIAKRKTVGDALRTASNVSAMTLALLGKSPNFMGKGAIVCSWKTGQRRGPGFKRSKSGGPDGAPGAKRRKNQDGSAARGRGGKAGRGGGAAAGAGAAGGRGGKRKGGKCISCVALLSLGLSVVDMVAQVAVATAVWAPQSVAAITMATPTMPVLAMEVVLDGLAASPAAVVVVAVAAEGGVERKPSLDLREVVV